MLKTAFTGNAIGKTDSGIGETSVKDCDHSGLVIAPWVKQIKMWKKVCKIVSEDQ
jgi:hypothetical protein